MSGSPAPSSERTKWLILGGIGAFVLALFIFFSPLVGLVKHTFNYLPYYGPKEPVLVQRDGKDVVDTIYAEIPPFSFIDRYGQPFTDKDVEGKIIVADFFFTRCGTICPRMSVNMQQLQLKLNDDAFKDVVFLSHTVDPEHDTPAVLDDYAKKLEADPVRWKFLTGNAKDIYRMGNTGYLLSALEDSTSAEQFVHDGRFVLVDKQKHIRGYYDGTEASGMNALAADLKMLLKEERIKAKEAREAADR
ncbi:MAG: SCO family protein [Flavobacteriales bacterium]|nr:SCO family protein [Flavobacteriales bacterium]MCB9178958.1 SCO family protein [Flavobacteriales bacterium]